MAVRIGTNGDDFLEGTRLRDRLFGLAGDDTLLGGRGNDRLFGDFGDDILRGGRDSDRLFGGPGQDWADYRSADTGVTVNLADRSLNTGEAAGDRFSSIERIRGSQFNDILTGNSRDNVIEGLAGSDILNGGGGFDFARHKDAPAGVTASLADSSINTGHAAGDSYTSIEGLQGSDFGDTLIGNSENNVLIGGRGADFLNGGDGFDFAQYDINDVRSGVRADLADPSLNEGQATSDTYVSIEGLIGTRFRDRLFGDDLANDLRGQGGNDSLSARLGDDTVRGGDGNDRINGGYGNDLLRGDAGQDWFIFNSTLNAAENVDRIQSYSVRNDTIRLDDAIFTEAGPVGDLEASAFFRGAAAHDASDRIIFNRVTGALFYDPDGTGAQAQVQFAQLSAGLRLTSDDFVIS